MAWYSTGSVSLTNGSSVVIGNGTQFITNTKSGDIFICIADGVIYEIDQILAATQLTLKRPFGGTTNATAQYEIVPTTSYLKTLANQVADLITLYQGVPQNVEDAQAAASAAQGYRDTAVTAASNAQAAVTTAEQWKTAAATSATNAKTSETNSKTSETNAASSASAALGSKNAAGTSETNAKTSETNAKTSETNAKTSETNAKASETAALASKNAAGTSETNAKTSETNAASSASAAATSKTGADTSATNASNSAAAALASKNAAGTSETNAKTSENNAKTSETNSASSAAAAANSAATAAGFKFKDTIVYNATSLASGVIPATRVGGLTAFNDTAARPYTLPSAASLSIGGTIWMINCTNFTLTFNAVSGDSIKQGATSPTSFTLLAGEWIALTSDGGTALYVIGGNLLTRPAFDAVNAVLAYLPGRNKIRNGAIRVSQRSASTAVSGTANAFGGPDGFLVTNGGAGGTITQFISPVAYKGRTLPMVVQRADATVTDLSASKYWGGIQQNIEGLDVAEASGQPVSLSFVFCATLAGTYSVAIRFIATDGTTFYYVQSFAYPVAQAAQYVAMTTPPLPTTKAILATNAVGAGIRIGALNGGTFVCPAGSLGSWGTTNYVSAAGGTAWGSTANAFIGATEIQLEIGTPTPFERIPFDQDLARCQRYFCKTFPQGVYPAQGVASSGALFLLGGSSASSQYNGAYWQFPRTMRASPAFLAWEPIATANPGAWYDQASGNVSAPGVIALGDRGGLISIASSQSVTITQGAAWYLHGTADADI